MEAIILAGGFGSRLKQVVNNVPKPMAPIKGRPFLEILLNSLEKKGFSRVIFSLGYMAEKISNHFGSRFKGLHLTYIVEETPLGTGGATRLCIESCTQNQVFVFNGDTYLDIEIEHLKKQWEKNQNLILVGRHVSDTSRYGRLVVDGNKILSFEEKGISESGLISAGCYVMTTDKLLKFPINKPFSIERDYLIPEILKKKTNIEIFETKGLFVDIGIPEDYLMAQKLLANV